MAAVVWSTSPSLLESMMSTSLLEAFPSQVMDIIHFIHHIIKIQASGCRVGYGLDYIDSVRISDTSLTNFKCPLYVLQGAHFGFQCENWWIPVK